MEQYHELAKKYLKYQKHRTMLTILGVALASGVLFVLLTLFFSNFSNMKAETRKKADYEMVLLTEDDAIIKEIAERDYVKSAYVGTYYDINTNKNYENVLFINLKNPYRINHFFGELKDEFAIKGYVNDSLASYYLQGDYGNSNYILIIMFLFLSMIFAIIGVGIIRNSIQLNTLEQIKDYGIIRCVGGTFDQLKKIIFLMGFYQEVTGLLFGYIGGFAVAYIIGIFVHIKVSLHLIPVLFVAIAFIGDLYFVMQENCKIVKKLTPVSAVRGNFTAKKTKIRRRRKSVYGFLFGMEGDYAYKSLKANKGRYYKSVFAFGLGIASFIGISIFSYSLKQIDRAFDERYGEYQLYFYLDHMMEFAPEEIKTYLPSYDKLQKIMESDEVAQSKMMYTAALNVADPQAVMEKQNDDFMEQTGAYDFHYYKEDEQGNFVVDNIMTWNLFRLGLVGYDEEDYAKLQDLLIDGTLDVGEDGIVMVQQCLAYPYLEDDDMTYSIEEMYGRWYVCNDYKVGDKIKLMDLARTQQIRKQVIHEAGLDQEQELEYDENGNVIYDKEESERRAILWKECIKKTHDLVMEEGAYKEYTIKGIVKKDLTVTYLPMMAIVPLDNFCKITGVTREQSNGIKFSLNSKKISSKLYDLLSECDVEYCDCIRSDYYYEVEPIYATRKMIRYVSMFVIFIVLMSSVNIINTSASNLHLRRQELAQLRVIGVSKKRLYYIVVLEGVITAISANILGNVLGYAFIIPLRNAVNVMFQIPLKGTITASIIGLVVSTLILCGSVYFPIHKMGNSVVEDLNASGD